MMKYLEQPYFDMDINILYIYMVQLLMIRNRVALVGWLETSRRLI